MTLAEWLIDALEACGIDTVFGIPGVHTIALYRGLNGRGLRHITPRHEQGAGSMADGYARACGRPATCFIITGPGMTNNVQQQIVSTALYRVDRRLYARCVATFIYERGTHHVQIS